MAFTTENDVRTTFQLTSTTLVPSALIQARINDAHAEMMHYLDPAFVSGPAPRDLIEGETLLAGARVLESLAAKDAFDQRQVTVGGERIDAGERFASLRAIAIAAEKKAWTVLGPFVLACPVRPAACTTASVPVLGEV